MTKEQFVKACMSGGYCSKKIAEKYAENKTEFSEKDFEEVFRISERRMIFNMNNMPQHATHIIQNGKRTTSGVAGGDRN